MKINKDEYDYLIKIVNDNKLNQRISESGMNIDDELEVELYEYIEDKQLEIGFDDEYNLNEDGEILQRIIDKLSD